MKIITNTNNYGKICYVQVKDIYMVAKISKNKNLMGKYLDFINNEYSDNEFVKITNNSLIEIMERCDFIIDFVEYSSKGYSLAYLSNLLITLNYNISGNKFDQKLLEFKCDSIRDVIAYKRGELDYKIPLVFDGKVQYQSSDGKLLFESTIVDDCYVLKTTDGSAVQTNEYYDFYTDCIKKLFEEFYPNLEFDNESYKCVDRINTLIITVNTKNKKKENKLGNVLKKIKKGK